MISTPSLRRALRRQGLRLELSRARNDRDVTYGLAQITDVCTNMVVAGAGFTLSLDEVAAFADQP